MLIINPHRFGDVFEPTDIGSLVSWWDANEASTIVSVGGAGTEVLEWNDRKGSNNMEDIGLGPTLTTAAEGTVLRFTAASNMQMSVTAADLNPGTGDFTLMVVYRSFTQTKGAILGRIGTGAREYSLYVNFTSAGSLYAKMSDSVPVSTTLEDTTQDHSDGQLRLACITFDATANEMKLYGDDFSTTIDTDLAFNPGTIDPSNPFRIGSIDGATNWFEGDIGEIAYFNAVLSGADMTSMETHFRDAWDLNTFAADPGAPAFGTIVGRYSTYAASDYTLSGSEITQLNDISVNSNHVVNGQPTTATGPTLTAINGHNWMRYAGAHLLGGTNTDTDPGNGDQTMLAVVRFTGDAGLQGITGKLGAGNPHYLLFVDNVDGELAAQIRDGNVSPIILLADTSGEDYTDSTRRVVGWDWTDSTSRAELWGRSPFEEVDSDVAVLGSITPSSKLYIGSYKDTGDALADMDIAEVVYFSTILNFNEKAQWYHYFKRKWGFYEFV